LAKRKQFQSQELFEKILQDIPIEYPVVIKYTDGGTEAFFENGVRFYIKIVDGNISYVKSKFTNYFGDKEKTEREQYEWNIRRLLYTHNLGTVDEFNVIVDRFSEENVKLDSLAFEHIFVIEQEEKSIVKVKEPIKDDKAEEDYPF